MNTIENSNTVNIFPANSAKRSLAVNQSRKPQLVPSVQITVDASKGSLAAPKPLLNGVERFGSVDYDVDRFNPKQVEALLLIEGKNAVGRSIEGRRELWNLFARFSRLLIPQRFLLQPRADCRLNAVLLTMVGYGCFCLIGNRISTVTAHLRPSSFRASGNGLLRPRRRRKTSDLPASYSRYSSDMQNASSIHQQQRKCREAALLNQHELQSKSEFFDEATSGSLLRRNGLDALLEAVRAGRINVIYFENLSRLARSFVISVNTLKELVDVHGVRVISVSENIDTSNDNWELPTFMRSLMHEEYIKNLRAAVMRGQEDVVLKDISVGDTYFGYRSEPIPNSEQMRRGKNAKPRMRYTIEPTEADWVRKIFDWFVNRHWSIDEIRKQLTRLNAPKDRRSLGTGWGRPHVRGVLRNSKFIGIWFWGRRQNIRNPFTGRVHQEFRPVEEIAKWTRIRPALRIVDDQLFYQAQGLLDEYERQCFEFRDSKGRLNGSRYGRIDGKHLLQGLIKCRSCQSKFVVASKRYLICAGFQKGICNHKTRIDRKIAEDTILSLLSNRIKSDDTWISAVEEQTVKSWNEGIAARPSVERDLDRQIVEVQRKIDRLVDQVENGQRDIAFGERLQQRRSELVGLTNKKREIETTPEELQKLPTREWIVSKLDQLRSDLIAEARIANGLLQKWFGCIEVFETTRPGSKRKGWVGCGQLATDSVVSSFGISADSTGSLSNGPVIDFDFRPPFPWESDAGRVRAGFDRGLTDDQIASELDWPIGRVSKVLKWLFEYNDKSLANARKCQVRPSPLRCHERIAEDVIRGFRNKEKMHEIAKRIGVCRETVHRAIQHWHEMRGLPVPDGRSQNGRQRKANNAPATGPMTMSLA